MPIRFAGSGHAINLPGDAFANAFWYQTAIVLVSRGSVAVDLAVLSLAVAIGLAIGAIRFRGLKLGISGVLFSALVFGQIGFTIDPKVIEFLRNFGLIVFMYAMGLQVGPGFGASLKAEGIRLNSLCLCVLVLGALMTAIIAPVIPNSAASGLYSGAFTTTAALAAAQETLRGSPANVDGESAASRAALAYSITYPFGIVGPMLVVIALRFAFGVKVEDEKAALAAAEEKRRPPIEIVDFEVTLPTNVGKKLLDCLLARDNQIVFTRLLRAGTMVVPTEETTAQIGDIYRAIGPRERLAELVAAMGRRSSTDFNAAHGDVSRMDLVVTRTHVLHRSLREMDLIHRTGVTIANINRSGIPLMPSGSLRLAFADKVTVVGPKAGLAIVETELGNSTETLNHSQLIPIFLGIVLGVIVGSIPLAIPGLNGSVRIGLAGGSLLAAIALSRLGSVGAIVWYMPAAANQLFLNFGLAIFLACVGFQAGDHFVQRAAQSAGLQLFLWGCLITLLPITLVACFARIVLRMNFIALSGWIAGAMGNSTTLLFAEEMTSSNAAAVTYAAVVPLATLAPIICAQILAIFAR
jgi:putative transport protein